MGDYFYVPDGYMKSVLVLSNSFLKLTTDKIIPKKNAKQKTNLKNFIFQFLLKLTPSASPFYIQYSGFWTLDKKANKAFTSIEERKKFYIFH
jgi:hypothetical protein